MDVNTAQTSDTAKWGVRSVMNIGSSDIGYIKIQKLQQEKSLIYRNTLKRFHEIFLSKPTSRSPKPREAPA